MTASASTRLAASVVAGAVLCLTPTTAAPALAAPQHKRHSRHKAHARHKTSRPRKAGSRHKTNSVTMPKPAAATPIGGGGTIPLTEGTARAVALASASELNLDASDRVSVTGCTSVAGAGYSCDVELQAADGATTCHLTDIIQQTAKGPEVVDATNLDCSQAPAPANDPAV